MDKGVDICNTVDFWDDAEASPNFAARNTKITIMKKTIIFAVTAFSFIMLANLIMAQKACAAGFVESNGIRYEISHFSGRPTQECVIVGFSDGYEPEGELIIPGEVTYEGKQLPVVGIGWTDFTGHEITYPAIIDRKGITSVSIPNSMRFIGSFEFQGCPNIEKYTVADGCYEYKSQDGMLLDRTYTSDSEERWGLLRYPSAAQETTFALPAGISSICRGAFAANKYIKKVYISGEQRLGRGWQLDNNTIEEMDCSNSEEYENGTYGAVYDGSSLVAVCPGKQYDTFIVPTNVKYISDGAFCSSNVKKILLHSWITSFANELTFMNSSVESIDYPDAVAPSMVWYNAFRNCRNLKSIKLKADSQGLLEILTSAFPGCESLEEVKLADDIKYIKIGSSAFYGCSSLTAFPVTNSMKIKILGSRAFAGCRALQSFSLGTVVEFDEQGYQFQGCGLKQVHWPSNIPDVPRGIFMDCKDLAKVDLKQTTRELYWDAFRGSGLTAISLAGVEDFSTTTFADCPAFSRIYLPDFGTNSVDYAAIPFIPENSQVVLNHDRIRGLDSQTAEYSDKAALYLSPVDGGFNIGDGWRKVYVPGQTEQLYSQLTKSPVEVMFTYNTFPEKKAVEVISRLPEVKITSVTIEGEQAVLSDGLYVAENAQITPDRMNVTVNYKVSNCPMSTSYVYVYAGMDTAITDGGNDVTDEWYDLGGIRVEREGLAPGIYLHRQGSEIEKVIVK